MSLSKTRFGIIGCGVIAPWHADAISGLDEAELTAVCDCIPEKAEKMAQEYGARAYDNYHDLLASTDVDAVCICTPSGMHADMAIDAARAGKHILSEKPIDINLDKIDLMIQECRKAGVKLGCIFQRRTSPLWRELKDAVECNALGKMVLGDIYLKYYRSQKYYDSGGWRGTWALDGGGALINQGVHMVDILQWIMGPITSLYGRADHLVRNIETEDTAVAVVTFANGAFGVIQGTTSVYPGMKHRLELHGEQGTILVEGEKLLKWEVEGQECKTSSEDGQGGVDIKLGTAETPPTPNRIRGHQLQILDLIQAIREDRDPMVNGEEARKSVEIILAIYESARTGRPVEFPLRTSSEMADECRIGTSG